MHRRSEMSQAELRWDEKGWAVLRWNESSWEELRRHLRSNEMRWDEKRWEELRRGEIRWEELRWDELRCSAKLMWSVGYEECSVKGEVWSLDHKASLGIAPWSCAHHVLGHILGHNNVQSTHARAWLAHGASKFYRWKVSCGITIALRQLLPRLVRVLLVVAIKAIIKYS